MSVEAVVADVGDPVGHPLDADVALGDVEVVVEEVVLGGRRLPVEVLGDAPPELVRVLHGLLVLRSRSGSMLECALEEREDKIPVGLHGREVGLGPDAVQGLVDVGHVDAVALKKMVLFNFCEIRCENVSPPTWSPCHVRTKSFKKS